MADDPKLWLALITGGLALAGTVYASIMSQRGRREQDDFKATTDQRLAALRESTETRLVALKSTTDRLLARLNAELQAERDARLARAEAEKMLARFRDPLMHAAYDLQSRIYNILKQTFLARYYVKGSALEREYAVENTVFLIAQFLGWTELIRQEVQFLDLGSDGQTRRLRTLQDDIYALLQSDKLGSGFRLFAGEQRAVGELMIDRAGAVPRCIGFAAFLQSRPGRLDYWLDPLRDDVKQMSSNTLPFTPRLIAAQHLLIDLLEFLDPDNVRFPAATRTKV